MKRPKILFVDDELYRTQEYVEFLRNDGFDVQTANSVDAAFEIASEKSFDLFLLDMMMPHGSSFSEIETAGGFRTGLVLARRMRELYPSVKIVAFSHSDNPVAAEWFSQDENAAYLTKSQVLVDELADALRKILSEGDRQPKVFIVHGHDRTTLLEVKNFLQNRLGLPEPGILADLPSNGLTLIEKFEKYAKNTDLVFVLFTPDDVGSPAGSSDSRPRPRANVVFELGYFLGALRRRTGRVFVLKKGDLEFPSDISGLVYIDITDGIESAGESIRSELAEWL